MHLAKKAEQVKIMVMVPLTKVEYIHDNNEDIVAMCRLTTPRGIEAPLTAREGNLRPPTAVRKAASAKLPTIAVPTRALAGGRFGSENLGMPGRPSSSEVSLVPCTLSPYWQSPACPPEPDLIMRIPIAATSSAQEQYPSKYVAGSTMSCLLYFLGHCSGHKNVYNNFSMEQTSI